MMTMEWQREMENGTKTRGGRQKASVLPLAMELGGECKRMQVGQEKGRNSERKLRRILFVGEDRP
jgi:hypothetical protein